MIMKTSKTFVQKPADVTRTWYVIDASVTPLGRLASAAAMLLSGKGKATFTPHVDGGDYVIIINAGQTVVTGTKVADKKYYHYSGYPGGLSERTFTEQMEKDPSKILEKAIYGMLPVNKLRPGRMERLKIYTGAEHNHHAQKPVNYEVQK